MTLNRSTLLILVVASMATTASAWARIGNEGSGGGSGFAAEFAEFGYRASEGITQLSDFPVTSEVFKNVVQNTLVEFVSEKLKDTSHREVDALNFPNKKLIRINVNRWQQMLMSPAQKYQLVIHEYLGILNIDDSGYQHSRLLLNGGAKLNNLVCTIEIGNETKGILNWYTIGDSNSINTSVATFALQDDTGSLNMQGHALVGLSAKDGETGYLVGWSMFTQEQAFISYKQFTTPGKFNMPFFTNRGFNSQGMPIYEKSGEMNCEVETNN